MSEWAVRSAGDAAAELVRLVEATGAHGWSWRRQPSGAAVDLRGDDLEGVELFPLVLPDGAVLGTVGCPTHPTGEPLDAALRAMLHTTVLAVAMERRGWAAANRAEHAERLSRHDALTGLPNRRLWDEVLQQEQARCDRHGYRALVAVVDLDDLKDTNDSQGHLAGDVLLRLAAESLRAAVRDTDMVARLGGDEFAVLAVEFEDGDPDGLARRLESALAERHVRASIGVAVAGDPTDGRPLDLVRATELADRRMYDVKRRHKGTAVGEAGPALAGEGGDGPPEGSG